MDETETEGSASPESKKLEAVGKWRAQRTDLIAQGKGSVSLVGGVSLILHFIPRDSLERRPLLGPWKVSQKQQMHFLANERALTARHNRDGFLAQYAIGSEKSAYRYTQVFRCGILEYGIGNFFRPIVPNNPPLIIGQYLEQEMVASCENAMGWFQSSGQTQRVYVGFSLVGIAGKAFFSTRSRTAFSALSVGPECDIFSSPETLADPSSPGSPTFDTFLLPLVDVMWQVAGYDESPFRVNGEWQPFNQNFF